METQDTDLQYLLTKFKYIFGHGKDLDNKAQYSKRFGRYMNYQDIMNILFSRFPDLRKAYIRFNRTAASADASDRLSGQILAFADSGIEEYIPFYNLLVNWSDEIIHSFTMISRRNISNTYSAVD